MHSVEKIGGTSMSAHQTVMDNIILNPATAHIYHRIFVVSAYSGVTNRLLEHKKTKKPGIYTLFAQNPMSQSWLDTVQELKQFIFSINEQVFSDPKQLKQANAFISLRLNHAVNTLNHLQQLCIHHYFNLKFYLKTVLEMLASIGEAHSAWNLVHLLKQHNINACFIDLTSWNKDSSRTIEEQIKQKFHQINLAEQLPIATGYVYSPDGLVSTYGRGYSEITLSKIATLTQAREAVIHKEFHLSSADPELVGTDKTTIIGHTHYNIADLLANLGMEAIHPQAADNLRQKNIPLRIKNTFQPQHAGTLFMNNFESQEPGVEIITGCQHAYILELSTPGRHNHLAYDIKMLDTIINEKAHIVYRETKINRMTYYLRINAVAMDDLYKILIKQFIGSDIHQQPIAIVSIIGYELQFSNILAQSTAILSQQKIPILAIHQSMQNSEIQIITQPTHYQLAIQSLHRILFEQSLKLPVPNL